MTTINVRIIVLKVQVILHVKGKGKGKVYPRTDDKDPDRE